MLLKMGRGMGSPIPSLQEGAWTCEGPKVGGEDYAAFKIVLRSTDLEPCTDMVTSGQLVLSLVTWMCPGAAWSTGHSAIHSLLPLDGQASWVKPCVETLPAFKGGQVHYYGC